MSIPLRLRFPINLSALDLIKIYSRAVCLSRKARKKEQKILLRENLTRFFLPPIIRFTPISNKKRGEAFMETRPDLHKRGYDLMDSGLN
jgi:hypothetical protein